MTLDTTIFRFDPEELLRGIAARARARRLGQALTQAGLAARAGVSLASLKRFERTGQVSLESLLRIAQVLDSVAAADGLFAEPELRSLDDLIRQKRPRQRGRRS